MKKYIPYIVIVLMVYLLGGFIRMQFNPADWGQDVRIKAVCFTICLIGAYPVANYMIKEMKE